VRARRGAYRVLVGRLEGKRLLGRPSCIMADNIKTDLKETGWEGMDWIVLAQDRDKVVSSCECGNGTSCFIKCREFDC
jgi:hypothetical protein